MHSQNSRAFTLVELIVVITILAILGTIGFISIGSFSSSARDSQRASDIANMTKALDLHKAKDGSYPLPINAVAYTGGMNNGVIITQGELEGARVGFAPSKALDPLTKTPYVYSVLGNGSHYQIASELESPLAGMAISLVPNAYAAGPKTALTRGSYMADPLLPSLITVPGSVPGTNGGIFSSDVCFVTSGSSTNTASASAAGCTKKKDMTMNILDPSLVAYWDMESASGSLLKDLSGNGNHGTGSGTLTIAGTGGIVGLGTYMTSTTAFNCGTGASLATPGDITVEFIAKATYGGVYVPVSRYGGTDSGWELVFNTVGSMAFDGRDSSTFFRSSGRKGTYTANTWYMYTGQRSGSVWKMYVNGKFVVSTDVGTKGSIYSANVPVMINSEYGNSFYGATWIFDDIKIYKRALSDTEILQHAQTAGF